MQIMQLFRQRTAVDMGSGPVGPTLITLAVPLMTSLFFQNLYAFIDTIFVSWLGNVPLAAVSLAVPLLYLALSLAKGISMGSVVLLSHARGAADALRIAELTRAILPLMLLLQSLFLPLLIPAVCRAFFVPLGADEGMLAPVYGFTFWLVLGFPLLGYVMTAEALAMSHGNTVLPMKAMVIGNVINILLDPVLIFTAGLGAAGASLATLVGQAAAAIYLYRGLGTAGYERPRLSYTPSLLPMWRLIAGQGFFIALSYLVIPVGLILLNRILAQFGAAAVAAWNVMSRLEMLVMLPVMGLSNALAAFISFNMGRMAYQRVRQAIYAFFRIAASVVIPLMLVFLLWPQQVVALFQPPPEVIALSQYALRASGAAGIFALMTFGLLGVAQGLKKPYYMVAVSVCNVIVLRVPVAYLLAQLAGETGVFWSHTTAAVGTAILAGLCLRQLWRRLPEAQAG